jgi:hypothetical protein
MACGLSSLSATAAAAAPEKMLNLLGCCMANETLAPLMSSLTLKTTNCWTYRSMLHNKGGLLALHLAGTKSFEPHILQRTRIASKQQQILTGS